MNDTVGLKNLKAEAYLPSHRVEIWNGFVFTNLDPNAKPLAPTLTKLTKELENYHIDEMVSMPVAELRGNNWNWKAQLENGIEPYHSAYLHGMLHDFAHVRLTSFVDLDPDEGAVYHPTGFYHPDAGFNATTKALLPIIPTLGEKERNQVIFASVPPNLGFGAVPEGLFYYLVLPAGPDHMNLRIGHLYPEESTRHPASSSSTRSPRTAWSCSTSRTPAPICRSRRACAPASAVPAATPSRRSRFSSSTGGCSSATRTT